MLIKKKVKNYRERLQCKSRLLIANRILKSLSIDDSNHSEDSPFKIVEKSGNITNIS